MSDRDNERFPLRFSLFPFVPPFLRILEHGVSYEPPLPEELAQFTWNAPSGISPIILNTVQHSGFLLLQGNVRKKEDQQTGSIWDCLPITEKSKDEINFSGLSQEVKINQFPGLFIIGRKDHLWKSYEKMRNKFGREHFDFLPHTYILPADHNILKSLLEEKRSVWIVKPPNWFCGIGISLIDNKDDIPVKKSVTVVQEYIDNPFLIRGLKFDLRLYVLLTSVDPVRLYIYEDGLVRFATKLYSNAPEDIKNLFIHLTNFSVNKNNEDFVYNTNPGKYEGHKWDLKTLWKYFEEELKIDWKPVWEEIKDVCLKTVLCGRDHMHTQFNKQIKSDYNCYKLFGFDVFLDSDLKPWIIEVNNIPSLHVNDIDAFVNYPMVAEMFNIVGFTIPKELGNKRKLVELLSLKTAGSIGHDVRIYSRDREASELEKVTVYSDPSMSRDEYCETILDDLTPSDLRKLIHTEDERSQAKVWSRLLPTDKEVDYVQFMTGCVYNDRLLDAWERKYSTNRQAGVDLLIEHCQRKEHLILPDAKMVRRKKTRDRKNEKKSNIKLF